MREMDDGPGHARGTTGDGEDDEPREEEDEDVGAPHPRVREPLRVPVQIRRCLRLHIQIRHLSLSLSLSLCILLCYIICYVSLDVAGCDCRRQMVLYVGVLKCWFMCQARKIYIRTVEIEPTYIKSVSSDLLITKRWRVEKIFIIDMEYYPL